MERLRVRVYNVRFGDAILVSVPDRGPRGRTQTRHILIDVGNVAAGEGGPDALFEPVLRDVLAALDGRPLDLYVMTHEHMDHIQGLPYAAARLGLELKVRYAWLTASAAEDYYERHPQAKEHRLQALAIYETIAAYLQAAPEADTPWMRALMLNNDPRRTEECVRYLRGLADKTAYVYRGCDLTGQHPFREARLEVLAPEGDTSVYYGRFQPMALGVAYGSRRSKPELAQPLPPRGVDAGAFYDLVELRRRGPGDNMLALDRAANNTSVVFTLSWRGWKLLFPGDAEQRSWQTMNKYGVLSPVHFLKVSHHGSRNGTPSDELLDTLLPEPAPDGRKRMAVVSAFRGTYSNVPDAGTLETLAGRAELYTVEGLPDGGHVDISFES